MSKKFLELLNQFQKAIGKLTNVLELEENEYIRDSAIQRFEFAFELSWKVIKAFLETKAIICRSSKDCFREAFQQELIDYDQIWTDEMIKARNRTVHTYNEDLAEKIYSQLPDFLEAFKKLLENLKKEI
jgi:nucleotidyltransferase substrate binding protein (TIGR01987 family)